MLLPTFEAGIGASIGVCCGCPAAASPEPLPGGGLCVCGFCPWAPRTLSPPRREQALHEVARTAEACGRQGPLRVPGLWQRWGRTEGNRRGAHARSPLPHRDRPPVPVEGVTSGGLCIGRAFVEQSSPTAVPHMRRQTEAALGDGWTRLPPEATRALNAASLRPKCSVPASWTPAEPPRRKDPWRAGPPSLDVISYALALASSRKFRRCCRNKAACPSAGSE